MIPLRYSLKTLSSRWISGFYPDSGFSTPTGFSRILLKLRLNTMVWRFSVFTEFCVCQIFLNFISSSGSRIFLIVLSMALMSFVWLARDVFYRSLKAFVPLCFIVCDRLSCKVLSFGIQFDLGCWVCELFDLCGDFLSISTAVFIGHHWTSICYFWDRFLLHQWYVYDFPAFDWWKLVLLWHFGFIQGSNFCMFESLMLGLHDIVWFLVSKASFEFILSFASWDNLLESCE